MQPINQATPILRRMTSVQKGGVIGQMVSVIGLPGCSSLQHRVLKPCMCSQLQLPGLSEYRSCSLHCQVDMKQIWLMTAASAKLMHHCTIVKGTFQCISSAGRCKANDNKLVHLSLMISPHHCHHAEISPAEMALLCSHLLQWALVSLMPLQLATAFIPTWR